MRLIRVLIGAVVLLVIGLVVLVIALPGERIAKIAADQVKSYTGRDLVFDGDVGISWYPVFGVSTGPVSLSNADWSDAGPMFSAKSAAIGVNVMSLISGDIRVTRIEAISPDVLLEVHKDGRANWDLFGGEAPAQAPENAGQNESGGALILENLMIRDARLRYVDHGGDSFEIADVDASLQWPDPRKPADIAMTLRPAGEDVSVTATISDLETLMGGKVSGVKAEVEAAGARIAFDGRAGIAPQLGGLLDASVPSPDKLMAALGLPAAGVAGPASVRGQITYTKDGVFTLRDGSLTALGNSLSAQADVATAGAKPVVTAQFVAGKLDLSQFGGDDPETGGGESAGGDTGWSKAPIDASGLAAIDGEIVLAAEAIDLGNLKLGRSRMSVNIDNARAVFSLNEINAYDGLITGQFVANNRSGLSVGGKMKAENMELKGLLTDTMDISRFTGNAGVQFSFLGVGQSVHAIMNSLKGDAAVTVGQGTISGIDLDKLLRGRPGGGTTVFDALTGTAVIDQGVLTNEDLLLELPSVLAKGEGTVGLGERRINYLFTPQIKSSDEQGLAVPIRIKGSWDDPSIRPELAKALGIDEKQLKEDASKALEDSVRKELNLTEDDARSTEDAVKDAAEDEVKKQLLKLLGGD